MIEYRHLDSITDYVRELLDQGARIILAEKTARILARQGIPGEEIISWSADREGGPVLEKVTIVSCDESGAPDWVVSQIDEDEKIIVDANGHENHWVITNSYFQKRYECMPGKSGIYRPIRSVQKFLRLSEGIVFSQWGEEWKVDAGGYINITEPENVYVVGGRDFDVTYHILGEE